MGQGHQKPDHRGNFFMMPKQVIDSQAWRHASLRARVVFDIFMTRHTGFNNGKIAMSIHAIGKAIGNQNHGANSKAVAELIELGFLECMSDADHHHSRARAYRITCIPTGDKKSMVLASNEYLEWRPGPMKKRKFGGARTATQNPDPVAVTTTPVKFSVAVTATRSTENCGFEEDAGVAVTASILDNQSSGPVRGSDGSAQVSQSSPKPRAADPIGVPLDELREWTKEVIRQHGHGGQRKLAQDSGVPDPALSRFRAGKSLPKHYLVVLQTACGRALPYVKWKAEAA